MAKILPHIVVAVSNMMFNFYPWGLSVNIVIPVSPEKTRVLYRAVKDDTLAQKGAGSILDTVEIQDRTSLSRCTSQCAPKHMIEEGTLLLENKEYIISTELFQKFMKNR